MTQHTVAVAPMQGESIAGVVLADLALMLLAAFLFVRLAGRFRQPAVMGEIIAGSSPSASMASSDLPAGIISIRSPGGGSNSTSSLRSTTQVSSWCGTP